MAKKINTTHLEKVDYDGENDVFFALLTTGEIVSLDYELSTFKNRGYVEGLECDYMKVCWVSDANDNEVEDWNEWEFSEGFLNEVSKRVGECATEEYKEMWYEGSKEEEEYKAESAYLLRTMWD